MNIAFQRAVPILEKLEDNGFEAYFVGGAVRDAIIGRDISDVDIATSATPDEVKKIFLKTVDVGIEHGTVLVLFQGEPYEVTTFRAESQYVDFRRPAEVKFIRNLKEDLQRRDFTMNSIALDKHGVAIDPFSGMEAIKLKQIVTVGKADERFTEDALRMMRALRFHSQLNFDIERNTYEALKHNGHLLQHIAVERKLVEFNKLLVGNNRKQALQHLVDTGLYIYLPGLAAKGKHISALEEYDYAGLTLEEMWAFILYGLKLTEPERKIILKSWRMPAKTIKYILSLSEWLHDRFTAQFNKRSLYRAGKQKALSANRIYEIITKQERSSGEALMEQYHHLPIKDRSELQLTGDDLMNWFNKPAGPWIKACIEEVEAAVVYSKVKNTNDSIREWLLRCNQN